MRVLHDSTKGDSIPVRVSRSTLPIDTLVASFDSDPTLKDSLQAASVIIVPTDLRPQYEGPVFPNTTREVFQHLQQGVGHRAVVEAAVRDEDYIVFEYRSDEIILPVLFIAYHGLLPLVISLLASYVYDLLKNPNSRKAEGTVKSELHVKDRNGKQLSFKYDGPAATFERVILERFRELRLLPDEDEAPDSHD